jgi:hypothetical protein
MVNMIDIPELYYPVKSLQRIRGHQAELKPRNDVCQDWFRAFIAADCVVGRKERPTLLDSEGRPIAEQIRQIRAAKRQFDTKRLKRTRPTDYQRCRALRSYHRIFSSPDPVEPGDYDFALPDMLPDVPKNWNTLDDLHAAGVTRELVSKIKLMIAPELKEWNRLEKERKDEIDILVENYQQQGWWNGEKFTFEDGWTYSARQLMFNAKIAEQILPPWVTQQFSTMVGAHEQWNTRAIDPDKPGESVDFEGDTEPDEGD